VAEAEAMAPTHVVISPGPGRPEAAGVSEEIVRTFAGRVPTLGVCLGHQAIVQIFWVGLGVGILALILNFFLREVPLRKTHQVEGAELSSIRRVDGHLEVRIWNPSTTETRQARVGDRTFEIGPARIETVRLP